MNTKPTRRSFLARLLSAIPFAAGLLACKPAKAEAVTKFLSEDGTWRVPAPSNYYTHTRVVISKDGLEAKWSMIRVGSWPEVPVFERHGYVCVCSQVFPQPPLLMPTGEVIYTIHGILTYVKDDTQWPEKPQAST